ncbi:MAG: alpha/beta fold hydrolase [Pseudonocardia sp.]
MAGIAGGALGLVATGAAVGVAFWQRSRLASERSRAADAADMPAAQLGRQPAGKACSVIADDGIRLSADVIEPADGQGPELTVVLVHGFALDRRSWHFQRLALSDAAAQPVRLVLYDQRSHGQSDRAPRETSDIERLGYDLDAVIRALAPEGPVALVGHSMGGMAIMALADDRPELFTQRVAGVALLSTSAGEVASKGLPGALLSRRNPVIRAVALLATVQPNVVDRVWRLGADVIWAMVRAYGYGDRAVDPTLVELVNDMIGANGVDAMIDFSDTLGTHDRLGALPALAGCEVLIGAGDADRMIPFRHSEVIAAELPDATLLALPGAGHLPMLEQPDAVNAALAELIARSARRAKRGWRRLRRWGA